MSAISNNNGSITEKSENELVFLSSAELVKKTVARLSGGRRVFTVTDENVARLHPELLPERDVCVLKAGEDSKTLANAENVSRNVARGNNPQFDSRRRWRRRGGRPCGVRRVRLYARRAIYKRAHNFIESS